MKRAVVIGAGHNGLVCAAYLTRAGWSVTVLEKRGVIGGCAVTESPWPGYQISTASYLVSLLKDEIVRDLELAKHGYQVYPKDPPFFTPFPDGRALFMWRDSEKTLREIAQFSERDALAFPKYEAHLERLARMMDAMDPVETPELRELQEMSVEEFLSRWFESEEIKATLATDGLIGAYGGPHAKGSAYVLLHHCMGKAAGSRGLWGFVRGGMGALSNALAASCGAEIRTNSTVEEIRPGEIRLQGGEVLKADAIVSGIHPKLTYALAGEPDWRPDYLSRGVSMKMNLALSALPRFRGRPPGEGPEHRATVHICREDPMIEMGFPSVYDDSLAPAGKHVASLFIQYASYDMTDAERDAFAERVIDLVERYAPGFRELILHRQVLGPRDLEERFSIPGGNIFHGDLIESQLFSRRPSVATNIRGLFLCGSGTSPGGGVMGAPGYNAAQAVIKFGSEYL